MTRYTVVWDADVETPFMNAWIAGDSRTRAVLTEIADWVDKQLAENPDVQGRPCPELSARTLDVPLASSAARVSVTYQVLRDDRLVRVIQFAFRVV
jgi:hypothetical protein